MAKMSNSLVKQFAKTITQSVPQEKSKSSNALGTLVKEGNIFYAMLDGSTFLTPVSMSMSGEEGDRVLVTIQNHSAIVTSNITAPGATTKYVERVEADLTTFKDVTVKNLLANYIRTDELEAKVGTFGYLKVETAEATYLKTVELEAKVGTFGYLKSEQLESEVAKFGYLKTGELAADVAKLGYLKVTDAEATYLKVDELEGKVGTFGYLKVSELEGAVGKFGYLTADQASLKYAQIDFANVTGQVVGTSLIKDGAITDAKILGLSANKITAGILDAAKITVTNLNADNITVGTLNGKLIGTGSVDLNKLAEEVPTKEYLDSVQNGLQDQIDKSIQTYTVTAIPLLNNEPAQGWATEEYQKHVGDICYVVNPGGQADGYTYRFEKDGDTYGWSLIKDSQVTEALQKLLNVDGDLSGLKLFQSETSSWITKTDSELSSVKSRTTAIETTYSTKEEAKNLAEDAKNGAIDEAAKDATSKANQAKTDAINTAASDATSKANSAKSEAISAAASDATSKANSALDNAKKYADDAVDGIEIGGRNLLPGTHKTAVTMTYPVSEYADYCSVITTTPLNGETYTLSFWAKSTVNGDRIVTYFYNPSNVTSLNGSQGQHSTTDINGYCLFTLSTVLTKYWVTYTIPKNGNLTRNVIIPRLFGGYGTGEITVQWEKLEKGTKATDWTPAPEDIDQALSTKVETTTFNEVKQTVDTNSAQITQMTKTLEQKADGSAVESLQQTVNTVQQTANENVSKISQVTQSVEKAQSAADDANNKIDIAEKTRTGGNLIKNGYGELLDNTNFKNGTFTRGDCPDGCYGYFTNGETEKMPFNPNLTYELEFYVRLHNGASGTNYFSIVPHDVDGLQIGCHHILWDDPNLFYLSKDLKNGDTVAHFVDLNKWRLGTVYTYQRGFLIFGYKDSTGYTYPDGTYSRNYYSNMYTDDSSVDKVNNIITLRSPWKGGTVKTGTCIGHSYEGSTYCYYGQIGSLTNTDWKKCTSIFEANNNGQRERRLLYAKSITVCLYNSVADYAKLYLGEQNKLTPTVETLSKLTNEVKQTADSNSAKITQMNQTVAQKADGSKVTKLEERTSLVEQNLSGFKSEVSSTYTTKTEFENLESTYNSYVQQTDSKIAAKLESSTFNSFQNGEYSNFKKSTNEFIGTSEAWEMRWNKIFNSDNAAEDTYQSYITFQNGEQILGNSKSNIKLHLKNDVIQFEDSNGNALASFDAANIYLGKNSKESIIDLCNSSGKIAGYASEYGDVGIELSGPHYVNLFTEGVEVDSNCANKSSALLMGDEYVDIFLNDGNGGWSSRIALEQGNIKFLGNSVFLSDVSFSRDATFETSITVKSQITTFQLVANGGVWFNQQVCFASAMWNKLGDDVYFGDQNIAGGFCIYGNTGSPGIYFSNTEGSIFSLTSQWMKFRPGPEDYGCMSLGVTDNMWGLFPDVDNYALNIGTSGHRWRAVYAKNATIQTSDERVKTILGTVSDKYLEFFNKIDPIIFKWNDGDTDTRLRIGLGAQTVERALFESGINPEEYAGLNHDYYDNPGSDGLTDRYSMDYIMYLLIAATQTKKNTYTIKCLESQLQSALCQIEALRDKLHELEMAM
jgi:hypothetical protein